MSIETLRAPSYNDIEAVIVGSAASYRNDHLPAPPQRDISLFREPPTTEHPLHPLQSLDIRQPPPFLLLAAGPIFLLLSDGIPESQHPASTITTSEPDIKHIEGICSEQDGVSSLTPEQPPQSVYDAQQEAVFVERLTRLRSRIHQLIGNTWFGEYDAYEQDNLVQAGIIYLWRAYRCNPAKLDAKGDAYWYAIAKCGAKYEVVREFRQRFRQKGRGAPNERQKIEVVLSAGDLLAAKTLHGEEGDLDETSLSCDTQYTHDTEVIRESDCRMDIPTLEHQIFTGTDPVDHPLIRQILGYMRDGLSQNQMADCLGVKSATIRCTVRRMRQACGALQKSKENQKHPGNSLDEKIRTLRSQGVSGPDIGRRIDMNASFVYRRLRAMNIVGTGQSDCRHSHLSQ